MLTDEPRPGQRYGLWDDKDLRLSEIPIDRSQERALTPDARHETPDELSGNDEVRPIAVHLRLLWEYRVQLCRVCFAGILIFTLIAFLIPKRYESTARLMPPDSKSSSSGLGLLAAMSGQLGGVASFAGDALGLNSSGALFVGILNSRTIQDRLVQRFDLKHVYRVRLDEDARKSLAGRTAISEDRKSGIITITVTDLSPQRAAAIAEAYVEELNRLVEQLSTSSAHRERVFLEERLKTVKADLDDAAERFGQFASKNTAIDIQAQGKAMVDAAAQLQGQMIAAQAELQGLKQIYTDSNVRVREIQARIAELQRQLEKLGGQSGAPARGLSSADDPSYPTIRQLPLLGITYADLYRRTKIEETVYEVLTQQYELAKVQEVREMPSVKVLDAAAIPERKSYPPRLLIMVAGLGASLVCGVIWILLTQYWMGTDPLDPNKVFFIEVFGETRKYLQEVPGKSAWAAVLLKTLHRSTKSGDVR
jgi:capsule polysaccharide export protein KpsE/RkpR